MDINLVSKGFIGHADRTGEAGDVAVALGAPGFLKANDIIQQCERPGYEEGPEERVLGA